MVTETEKLLMKGLLKKEENFYFTENSPRTQYKDQLNVS